MDFLDEGRELFERGVLAAGVLERRCRETPVGDVFRDVRDDSRFGSQNGFRADFKVSGDADLGGDGA